MKIKTTSGFTCEIPDGLTKDFRYVRARINMFSEDKLKADRATLDMVSAVFCDEKEEERFYRHHIKEDGRLPMDDVFRDVWEIVAQAAKADKHVKNS